MLNALVRPDRKRRAIEVTGIRSAGALRHNSRYSGTRPVVGVASYRARRTAGSIFLAREEPHQNMICRRPADKIRAAAAAGRYGTSKISFFSDGSVFDTMPSRERRSVGRHPGVAASSIRKSTASPFLRARDVRAARCLESNRSRQLARPRAVLPSLCETRQHGKHGEGAAGRNAAWSGRSANL